MKEYKVRVMSGSPEKQLTVVEARAIACRYLGRREYACKELADKLMRRGIPPGVVAETLVELESEGLVSDQRFAETFARSRVSRLYGPLKIRAELIKRGVDSSLINHVLLEYEDRWLQSAQQWIRKRIGAEPDRKEKARLYRSSTSRGFTHEQVMQALDMIRSGD